MQDPVRHAPALAGLTTLAALASQLIDYALVPALGPTAGPRLRSVDRWGDFATNLTATAGLVALGVGLLAFVRDDRHVNLQRRLMLTSFAGILVPTLIYMTILERERTTAQLVLLAVGATHVIQVLLTTTAARFSASPVARTFMLTLAGSAVCVLVSQVAALASSLHLSTWQVRLSSAGRSAGELSHLLVLLMSVAFTMPGRAFARERTARMFGLAVLGAAMGALYMAHQSAPPAFRVVLYHAQRFDLLMDAAPLVYAVPLAVAFGSALAGLVAGTPERTQMALGVLLLLAAGYAPQSAARLLAAALGTVLMVRATMSWPRDRPAEAAHPQSKAATAA